jgi:hypothetical protein
LSEWLNQATLKLSRESAAKVRAEIQEHFESTRRAALEGGAESGAAEKIALSALGDPRTANRDYRRVLLTALESRMLGEANWEASAICSRPLLKQALVAIPGILLFAAAASLMAGAHDTGARSMR